MEGRSSVRHLLVSVALGVLVAPAVLAEKGVIIAQELDPTNQGYTVIRLWGSAYQMGYAQATLLGDYIVQGVSDTKSLLGAYYNTVRNIMASAVWMPASIEDEFDGMVDSLAVTHPGANIDKLDLKVLNTAGEWLYACRSHTCWGRYVADPVKTLSTRRLDFASIFPSMNHHVLCMRVPADASPQWVNLAWSGVITAATGVNEFGTIVALHDYQTNTDFAAGRMARMVACRYALTYATDPDVSTHLNSAYAELQKYQIMTGSFVNYYAPEGHGGVMVCHPYHTPDFYYLRVPQTVWHHGEAMITTNAWTDGTYTPPDENFGADAYYNNETPKTLESHWDLLATTGNGLHQMSIAYRGRGDITVWADGRVSGGRTPRLEWEWWQLAGVGDTNCDGKLGFGDINAFVLALSGSDAYYAVYPDCRWLNADCNGDGQVTFNDINAFVALLSAP